MKANLSYNILKEFCKVRNTQNSNKGFDNPYTNRLNFIVDTILDLQLLKKGFTLNVDKFENTSNKAKSFANIELSLNNGFENSVMFVAHHDVNNINSDNCQDNSASITNLLSLAEHLTENSVDKNVHIVFTDCEEYGKKGAIRLSERIKNFKFGNVESIVNLELTANGRNFWKDTLNFKKESLLSQKLSAYENFLEVKTPPNDSITFRENDIDSVCIGIVNDEDILQIKEKNFCKTWSLCHRLEDTFENNANSEDMDYFVQILIKTI
jgi:hypothetical protein